ncbi:glycoside hydrolase family 3 protein [Butyrivibrio sp. AC2005]|uniref:glycoside hydrolase family 3 protein n=1 Tax=Butyrivibrio sp. AC2005 TaxID=1280672 RepID=UPI0003FDA13D|nr:glycoside hydrolase family 3 protein [Butyrivibrio sp. AC2005]
MRLSLKRIITCGVISTIMVGVLFFANYENSNASEQKVDRVISKMSMDEKISQMIIPAFRTWNEENVTDLNEAVEIREALQKHQYGGVLLYGSNITGNEQVTRLVHDLQENNMQMEGVSTHIPYFMPLDEEGGIVIRLTAGTRMTGNMAIGATKDATANSEKTGELLGEELAAAGFNVDYAPVIDVNNNPDNPVIGTRSFSDNPEKVMELGIAYADGLSRHNVIATYKHYPGHGDTCTDSHIGTPSIEKTYEELSEMELIPFKKAIESGADMIMTAHITYPKIDEQYTFGDGKTKGYYPATMSKKMVTDILRTDLGFEGVVVTDALEMDAIRTAGLVPGEMDSVEYRVNIAEKVINAGVDILLLPADMNSPEIVKFYDDYIAGIAEKVKDGEISEERIDESVKRILLLKEKYGIFDPSRNNKTTDDIDSLVEKNKAIIGSEEHHEIEMDMAREAITLVKNDKSILPLKNDKKSIFVLGRLENDEKTLSYVLKEIQKDGYIDKQSDVNIDFYYDSSAEEKLHYTDEMREKINSADVVLGFSYASGSSALDKEEAQYIALSSAIDDVHKAEGKFILISENLPYDAAIYQDADAIILAYMGSGLSIDPTDRFSDIGTTASNANIEAAIETVFGKNSPTGTLPVNIPKVGEDNNGKLYYEKDYLYNRGFRLNYSR